MRMLCINPFVSAGLAFGCGQCNPCRFNRRKIWATRIMVEAAQYKDNAFVTLTYNDDTNPGSLVPGDLQNFMKRLREHAKRKLDRKLRFFACGEYGDINGRPHFHLALFNFPTCAYRRSRYSVRVTDCCYQCDLVRDVWGKGFAYLGEVENDSAGYICGYVTKKMTSPDDPRLPPGYHPEYARMSLKPGIGADAMFDVADILLNFQNTLDTLGDVPGQLTVGRKSYPLGRYLRKKLRTYVGRDEKAPQSEFDKIAAEMLPLRLAAKADKVNPSFKERLVASGEGRRRSIDARRAIFNKGRRI